METVIKNLGKVVPTFHNWDKNKEYEHPSIVSTDDGVYASLKNVPENIDIKNTDYWKFFIKTRLLIVIDITKATTEFDSLIPNECILTSKEDIIDAYNKEIYISIKITVDGVQYFYCPCSNYTIQDNKFLATFTANRDYIIQINI